MLSSAGPATIISLAKRATITSKAGPARIRWTAGAVRGGGVLPAWLLGMTRNSSANALMLARRRRRHERMAADMAARDCPYETSSPLEECAASDDSIERHLDEAMARLGAKDRGA